MSITLKDDRSFGGTAYPAGTTLSLDGALEANMVAQGLATWAGAVPYGGGPTHPAQLAVDDRGHITGLVGPDGQTSDLGIVPFSARTFVNGQQRPAGRPVPNPGNPIMRWMDHTALTLGGDLDGVTVSTVDGVGGITDTNMPVQNSRTGQKAMVKVVYDGTEGSPKTFTILKALSSPQASNGFFGFWMYWSPDSTQTTGIYVVLGISVDGNFSPASKHRSIACNTYAIKPGWNYICADTTKSSASQGIVLSGEADFTVSTVHTVRVAITTAASKSITLYLENLWTNGEKPVPWFCLGCDGGGTQDLIDYYAAEINSRGWKGVHNYNQTAHNDGAELGNYATTPSAEVIARLRQWTAAGNSIYSHSSNHDSLCNGSFVELVTDSVMRQLTIESTTQLIALGLSNVMQEVFGPAQNLATYRQRTVLATYGFAAIRDYRGQAVWNTWGHDNLLSTPSLGLDSPVSGTAVLSNWKAIITGHINSCSDCEIYSHTIIPGDGGDPTGETATGNSLQIYANSYSLLLDWLKEQETAGLCKVVSKRDWLYGISA